ncbi:MAG: PQQ-binding-like beta-propeller repeat protein [Planctomycetes bacterium]|nr:PQQ-binding-like beta-propeller repeat protein [Planctomycetota bacterium]
MMMAGDTIFCGTDGGVYAIHAETGGRLWTTAVEGRVEGLVVSQGRLLVNTSTGKTYCFSGTAPSRAVANNTQPSTRIIGKPQTERLASDLVSLAKANRGFFLLDHFGDAPLAAELARISDFRIVCSETDKEILDTMREQLSAAGLYGSRVVCHQWPEGELPYQRYLFNAIAVNPENGKGLSEARSKSIKRQLRPHGGLLAVVHPDGAPLQGLTDPTAWQSGGSQGTRFAYQYRGALAGEGTWTHPYADPGNSACSDAQASFSNSSIQWFGAPGPRNIVDRHLKSPPPVYAKGRVFITGSDYIAAVDAYNGTVLWEKMLADSGRVRTMNNCGNMLAMDDRLYVAHSEFCSAFDAQTGQQVFQTSTELLNTEWGYLAHVNGVLLGSSGRIGSVARPLLRFSDMKLRQDGVSCSQELFACDPRTGKRLWTYSALNGAIINPAIACSGTRVCFLESLDPTTLRSETGRADLQTLLGQGVRLVALDIATGTQTWEANPDLENVEFIVYLSATQDTVIVTGSCQKQIEDVTKNRYSMVAYDSHTGEHRWASLDVPGYQDAIDGNHGALNQHPAIVGDIIYGNGYGRYITTGEEYTGWKWTKSHKCATLSASGRYAFSRYEAEKLPFMFDLETGTQEALTTVSRPGCWINMLPVGGLVIIPEASSGCTCGYSLQTSMAISLERSEDIKVPSPGSP